MAAAKHSIETFSVTFKGTVFDESEFAARVASASRANHHAFDVEMGSLKNVLSDLVRVYGEPFGDDSALPTYLLFKKIKPFVKVVLTGDGGDEAFAGYKDVQPFLWRNILSPVLGIGDLSGARIRKWLLHSRWRKCREAGYGLMALGASGAALFLSLYRNGWTREWRRRFLRSEIWKLTGEEAVERETEGDFQAAGDDDLERYLNMTIERLTQAYLVKIDRASMASSIEARSPFLDVDLFDWTSGLDRKTLLHGRKQKSILKDLLRGHMGSEFTSRKKMGFTPPLPLWLRQENMVNWLRSSLLHKDSIVLELCTPEGIDELIEMHRKGNDQTGRLWRLIFLNEWHYQAYRRNEANNKMKSI